MLNVSGQLRAPKGTVAVPRLLVQVAEGVDLLWLQPDQGTRCNAATEIKSVNHFKEYFNY